MSEINFQQAFFKRVGDGTLQRSELRELKQMAHKTADKADDQLIAQVGAQFKDGADFNLVKLKLGEQTLTALPLFSFEDDIQAPSVEQLNKGQEVLQTGQEGSTVTTLKRRLNELGYQLPVGTGRKDLQIFGTGTAEQVKRFQQDYGIQPADGKVNQKTWQKLNTVLNEAQVLRSRLGNAGRDVGAQSGTVGKCYSGVFESVKAVYGYETTHQDIFPASHADHAYQAIETLSQSPHFKEIEVPLSELDKLPKGAIVVWENNPTAGSEPGHISGHISIASGDGQEYSDHARTQFKPHYAEGKHHVFLAVPPRTGL